MSHVQTKTLADLDLGIVALNATAKHTQYAAGAPSLRATRMVVGLPTVAKTTQYAAGAPSLRVTKTVVAVA